MATEAMKRALALGSQPPELETADYDWGDSPAVVRERIARTLVREWAREARYQKRVERAREAGKDTPKKADPPSRKYSDQHSPRMLEKRRKVDGSFTEKVWGRMMAAERERRG